MAWVGLAPTWPVSSRGCTVVGAAGGVGSPVRGKSDQFPWENLQVEMSRERKPSGGQ